MYSLYYTIHTYIAYTKQYIYIQPILCSTYMIYIAYTIQYIYIIIQPILCNTLYLAYTIHTYIYIQLILYNTYISYVIHIYIAYTQTSCQQCSHPSFCLLHFNCHISPHLIISSDNVTYVLFKLQTTYYSNIFITYVLYQKQRRVSYI